MATSKIARTDDTAATLQNIATISFTEDAETRHAQQCVIVDPTTPTQKMGVDASGHVQCDIAASSVTVPVSNTVLSVVGGGVEATAQRVTIASDSTGVLSVDDNGSSLTIDNAQLSVVGTGTEAAAMRVTIATDSTGVLSVDDNGGALTVDNGGTFAVQIAANSSVNVAQIAGTATVTGGLAGSQGVGGIQAHDAADANNNPIKVGLKAIAFGANPTEVAAADITNAYSTLSGVQFVTGPHMNPVTIEFTQADADGAQTNVALITVAGGVKIAVTQVQVLADQANTVETSVRIGFAAATLSAASTTPVAGIVASHPGIVPGSGISRGDGMGILGVGADGEDLRIVISDPVGGNNVVLVSYFTVTA